MSENGECHPPDPGVESAVTPKCSARLRGPFCSLPTPPSPRQGAHRVKQTAPGNVGEMAVLPLLTHELWGMSATIARPEENEHGNKIRFC